MVGLGGLAVASGCVDGSANVIQTGGLGTDQPDASHPIDASSEIDAPIGATCTGSPTDVGLPSVFVAGKPVYFSTGNFFVVRDAGGLYALTARCPHEGQTMCVGTSNNCSTSGTEFYCPRHGATFTFVGAIISGPVFSPLVHYSMCLMSNGHVGVTASMQVSSTTRLAA